MKTKFGIKQANRPTPFTFNLLVNIYLVILMPAIVVFITDLDITHTWAIRIKALAPLVGAMLKIVAIFTGNGRKYLDDESK